jgi:uncharacterized protein YceK
VRRALGMMAFAALATWFGGCGTLGDALCGPIDDHYFYRGVRMDVMGAMESPANIPLLVDVPFSAAADTVLLPLAATSYVASLARKDEHARSEKQGKPIETQEATSGWTDGPGNLQK